MSWEETFMISKVLGARVKRMNAEMQSEVEDLENTNQELQEEIDRLTLALSIETANLRATMAEVEAWEAHHPQSPLLSDSGFRFKDGKVKTQARIIFETNFDEILKIIDIDDPSQFRRD